MASGFAPGGRYSAYSSIAPTPRRLKPSSRLRPVPALLPVVALGGASLARIASHAFITALHALAVVFEPPATGAGGKRLSPSATCTCDNGTPSCSVAIYPTHVGASAV